MGWFQVRATIIGYEEFSANVVLYIFSTYYYRVFVERSLMAVETHNKTEQQSNF